jgi:hypothetical protein
VASFEPTTTQKNAVLDVLRGSGLDPAAGFEWVERRSAITQSGYGRPPYVPGPQGPETRTHAGEWQYVIRYIIEWAERVRAEHEAPDLWAELQQQRELMTGVPEALENTRFTAEERAQIETTLNEAKAYLRSTYELRPAQYEAIEAQLDYLIEASERIGRTDWRGLLVGTLLGLVVQAIVPPEPIRQVMFIVLRGLAGLFAETRYPNYWVHRLTPSER